jgi:hypothetical protein
LVYDIFSQHIWMQPLDLQPLDPRETNGSHLPPPRRARCSRDPRGHERSQTNVCFLQKSNIERECCWFLVHVNADEKNSLLFLRDVCRLIVSQYRPGQFHTRRQGELEESERL